MKDLERNINRLHKEKIQLKQHDHENIVEIMKTPHLIKKYTSSDG